MKIFVEQALIEEAVSGLQAFGQQATTDTANKLKKAIRQANPSHVSAMVVADCLLGQVVIDLLHEENSGLNYNEVMYLLGKHLHSLLNTNAKKD